jgi:hypothetical protein
VRLYREPVPGLRVQRHPAHVVVGKLRVLSAGDRGEAVGAARISINIGGPFFCIFFNIMINAVNEPVIICWI